MSERGESSGEPGAGDRPLTRVEHAVVVAEAVGAITTAISPLVEQLVGLIRELKAERRARDSESA